MDRPVHLAVIGDVLLENARSRGHALARLDEGDVRPWLHFAQLLSEVGIALGQRAKVAPKGRRCNDGLRHLIRASALLGLKQEHKAFGLSEHSMVRL